MASADDEVILVFVLDMLLDSDLADVLVSRFLASSSVEEEFAAAILQCVRQQHSTPALYSEQWIQRYVDEDFKINFRLLRLQFEVVLAAIEEH